MMMMVMVIIIIMIMKSEIYSNKLLIDFNKEKARGRHSTQNTQLLLEVTIFVINVQTESVLDCMRLIESDHCKHNRTHSSTCHAN